MRPIQWHPDANQALDSADCLRGEGTRQPSVNAACHLIHRVEYRQAEQATHFLQNSNVQQTCIIAGRTCHQLARSSNSLRHMRDLVS